MKRQDTLESQVNYAYLAIGSNLGKKIMNLEFAKYKLSQAGVKIIKSSGFYITKSWPNPRFPDYVNAVILTPILDSLYFVSSKFVSFLPRFDPNAK